MEKVKVAKIDRNSEEDDLEDVEILVVDPNEVKVQPPREQSKVKEKKAGNVALKEDALSSDDEEEGQENGEGPLFMEEDEVIPGPSTKTGSGKRKADAVEGISCSSDISSSAKLPAAKKAKKQTMIPGYTDGPPVQFLKVTNRLSKKTNLRGYPRIIDVQKFNKEKNKQKLIMADIVATVLYKHDL